VLGPPVMGLRQYDTAFSVRGRDELASWEREVDARAIGFTPAAETPIGTVVVFRDPDSIQLEFGLPASA
jgi:hypothetical protein